jgi:hypothetical protein
MIKPRFPGYGDDMRNGSMNDMHEYSFVRSLVPFF